MKPKVSLHCPHCDSTNIVKDASTIWDVDKQDFVLAGIYDSRWACNDCEQEFNEASVTPVAEPIKQTESTNHGSISGVFTPKILTTLSEALRWGGASTQRLMRSHLYQDFTLEWKAPNNWVFYVDLDDQNVRVDSHVSGPELPGEVFMRVSGMVHHPKLTDSL